MAKTEINVTRTVTKKSSTDFTSGVMDDKVSTHWHVSFSGGEPREWLAFDSSGIDVSAVNVDTYIRIQFVDPDRVNRAIIDRIADVHYIIHKNQHVTEERRNEYRAILERMAGAMGLTYPPAEQS